MAVLVVDDGSIDYGADMAGGAFRRTAGHHHEYCTGSNNTHYHQRHLFYAQLQIHSAQQSPLVNSRLRHTRSAAATNSSYHSHRPRFARSTISLTHLPTAPYNLITITNTHKVNSLHSAHHKKP